MFFPRLVLAGTNSGSGKTALSLAIMAALVRQGFTVQPFKVGPDYIDPAFHFAASGRPSYALDTWLMSERAVADHFQRHAPQSEPCLSVIEGVMGLFDGLGLSTECSTAHVASLLRAPVILVCAAEGMSLSAAAVVAGFELFRPTGPHMPDISGLSIAGVIINRVGGRAHYDLLRRGIEDNTGIPCLGYLKKNAFPSLPRRHLGLVPAGELSGLTKYMDRLADVAEENLELQTILHLARMAPPLEQEELLSAPAAPQAACDEIRTPTRIGVAYDAAFSFYYQGNLDLLRELGAELVFFSPLTDAALPDELDGLYLGGGFPDVFATELEANLSMRDSVRKALEDGLPAYAECGGMIYLCESLAGLPSREGEAVPVRTMVGFFPHKAAMTAKLQTFGYVTLSLQQDCVLGPAGAVYPGHEFHYSRLLDEPEAPAARMEKADGRNWTGGLLRNNVLGLYPHLHFRGCPEAACSFVAACAARHAARHDTGATVS